jgi:hypothetical protein
VERCYAWFADFAPPSTLERFAAVIDIVSAGGPPARPAGQPVTDIHDRLRKVIHGRLREFRVNRIQHDCYFRRDTP